MPFATKRKAHLQRLLHARQTKGGKHDETDVCGQDLGRAEPTESRETGRDTNIPCTLLSVSLESDLASTGQFDLLHSMQDIQLTPLRIVFDPRSERPASPLILGRQSRVERRRVTHAITNPIADVHATEPAVKAEPVPEYTASALVSGNPTDGMEPDPFIDWSISHDQMRKAAPSHTDAEAALQTINKVLRPPRNTGPGYKKSKLNLVTRTRCEAMAACLRFFLTMGATFIDASEVAATGAGRGIWHARRIRIWIRQLITMGDLPGSKHGRSSRSLLKNEDIASEIKLFLQSKGKHFVASDIVQFLDNPEVKQRLTLTKTINVRTAQRWLQDMEYRWQNEQPGQYFDGHEREDVVQYRQHVYAPKLKALEPFLLSWDDEAGTEKLPNLPQGQRQVAIWWHDASTFYAHDRRKLGWHHKKARTGLAKKGQGVSAMVADFVSAEYGFLKSRDGKSDARKILLAGKNREGYMTNDDICKQFRRAVDLVKQEYPDQDHIFIYDNARIHTKRSAAAPSARSMTKGESDFGAQTVDANGKKIKIRMENPTFPDGSEQELYLPNGRFKGMVALLQERGYDTSGLKAECHAGFKCKDPTANCCCRRILFNLIDLDGEQKSVLQALAKQLGSEVIFLPKFHCELNPIEQCWGYAKRIYRTAPPSSLTADVEKNMVQALNCVPLRSIRRFVKRSQRFVDAYAQGLDGPNAAAREWARRKFQKHRATPEHIDV